MKSKLLNLMLIITSLFGYLEWGKGNSAFLFQVEYELAGKLFSATKSVIHPFILLSLLGQLLLLITLFQKTPEKVLTYIGIACLALLLEFIVFIGIISQNARILVSALPFTITVIVMMWSSRKKRTTEVPWS